LYALRRWLCILLPLSFPLVYLVSWQVALRVPSLQDFHAAKAYKGGLAYYLWPPMQDSPDPLTLTRAIQFAY